MPITKNYLLENNYVELTCYNCQEKFLEVLFHVKSLNFCATCWNSQVKAGI